MRKNTEKLIKALRGNLEWFRNSGVLSAGEGEWGVAERLAVISGNEAIKKIFDFFPACTRRGNVLIVEQRRADCNFQTAWLFLLAGDILNDPLCTRIGENIIEFLYCRSGLLNYGRSNSIPGSWNWSHIKQTPTIYFDDSSWCVMLQLAMARRYPALGKKYQMKKWAGILADGLAAALAECMDSGQKDPANTTWADPAKRWAGRPAQPHFGALTIWALHCAGKGKEVIPRYASYLEGAAERFSVSEQAYALLGTAEIPAYRHIALEYAEAIVKNQQPDGSLPAQHNEAPEGKKLVDLIYTCNWALMGLFKAAALDRKFQEPAEKLLELVLSIQDRSRSPRFRGCWRGMFDLESCSWSGGDRFEGGANSIYTGWTNAPIAITLAELLLEKKSAKL